MKSYQLLFISLIAIFITACGGSQKVNGLKIAGKVVEAGVCVFGAKTTQQSVITTRGDCALRGGAYAPDISGIKDESKAEIL